MTENTLRPKRWRSIFTALSILSLSWVFYILWDAWPSARESLADTNLYWVAASLLGFIAGGYAVFEAFYRLFSWRFPGVCQRKQLANLFFSSQLMKHIPGRVWGIAYQVMMVRKINASEWVAINIVFMGLTSFFAVFVAGVVLLLPATPSASIAILIALTALYFYGWSKPVISFLSLILRRISFNRLEQLATALHDYGECGVKTKANIYMILFLSWLAYYASWGAFGLAWPSLNFSDGVLLCSMYTIAWFVGYISIATPSGLGVRELVFIALSGQFPPDAVAGMMIFGRFALLFADVMLGVIFMPFSKNITSQ